MVVPLFPVSAERPPRPYLHHERASRAPSHQDALLTATPPSSLPTTAWPTGHVVAGPSSLAPQREASPVEARGFTAVATAGDTLDDASLPDHQAIDECVCPTPHADWVAEQRGQLTAALLQIEATQTELVRRARDEVVELAIQIARHIVGRDVAREDHDLSPVIDDALSRLGDALSIVVRVGARHHAVVAERYGHGRVRVVLDHALRDGDVVLDSDCGSVDARLESRCDAVTSAIRRSTGLP